MREVALECGWLRCEGKWEVERHCGIAHGYAHVGLLRFAAQVDRPLHCNAIGGIATKGHDCLRIIRTDRQPRRQQGSIASEASIRSHKPVRFGELGQSIAGQTELGGRPTTRTSPSFAMPSRSSRPGSTAATARPSATIPGRGSPLQRQCCDDPERHQARIR